MLRPPDRGLGPENALRDVSAAAGPRRRPPAQESQAWPDAQSGRCAVDECVLGCDHREPRRLTGFDSVTFLLQKRTGARAMLAPVLLTMGPSGRISWQACT